MRRSLAVCCLTAVIFSTQVRAELQAGLSAIGRSDYPAALKELVPVAESGDAVAQYNLGKMYFYGWGVKKDEAEAARWFLKAAVQDDVKARKMLAYMYEQGVGVKKDPLEAKKWSTPVPRQKNIPAQAGRPLAHKRGSSVFLPNAAREGRSLTHAQADELERLLKTDQNNLSVRAQLLGYYFTRGVKDIGRQATIQARRRHIYWIIQNQPNSEIASLGEALISPIGHNLADREGYRQAKALWLKQVGVYKNESRTLLNATGFLKLHDKALTEDLLRKGEALYPRDRSWSVMQGYLYALGILGIDGLNVNGIPTSVNPAEQNGVFAVKARKAVEASKRPALVGTAGNILSQYGLMIRAMKLSERDYADLAEKWLLRAQAMEPSNGQWPEALGEFYSQMSMVATSPADKLRWSEKSLAQMEKSLEQTSSPESRKFQLMRIAKTAYDAGAFEKAEKYAKALLDIATSHKNDTKFGDAVHDGNMVLGRLALRRNDVELAKMYLLRSGQATGAGTLSSFGPNMSLAKELLARGEKETVIQYLQLCKKFWTYPRNPLDRWIQDIRSGRQPDFGGNLMY